MKTIRSLDEIPEDLFGSVVTIGNFDGIHLGHQRIFNLMVEDAAKNGGKTVVITFDPHPKKVIHPELRPFFLLTPVEEKLGLIERCGIDAVILIPFTIEFSRITAEGFVREILWEKLRLRKIFIGYDYNFGKDKGGNAAFLKRSGKELGFEVVQLEPVTTAEKIASSTRIRLAILDGDVRLVARMLGRYYGISGTVVKGYRRGTDMGFPTANIHSEKVIPKTGVYVIYAIIEESRYEGVLNIGYNPTFGNDQLSIEGHLFDFQGDIYGKEVKIFFVERLRDEMKFAGPEELAAQIQRDIIRGKGILAAEGLSPAYLERNAGNDNAPAGK